MDGFIEMRSIVTRRQRSAGGEHVLRYRSVLGKRLSVKAVSTPAEANYMSVADQRDSLRDSPNSWQHNGSIETGARGWQSGAAGFDDDQSSDALPSTTVVVEYKGDSPFDRVLRVQQNVPLS